MSWEYTAEEYKEHTRKAWNASSESYEPWIRALAAYDDLLLDDLDPQPGERVLDVATGPGEPALSIAETVGPEGQVLGIDISEGMIEQACEEAKRRGADNVSFALDDAEAMDLDDASFDAAVCRFSLQILPNPARALSEVRRVLEPGGRFATAVWAAPGERSPGLHALVGPMLRHCTPDETGYLPTPYELGGSRTLVGMAGEAGFEVVDERRVHRPLAFDNEEAYLDALLEGTPLGHSLREESEDVQEAILEETRWNLDRWNQAEEGLKLRTEAVVLHARRPE